MIYTSLGWKVLVEYRNLRKMKDRGKCVKVQMKVSGDKRLTQKRDLKVEFVLVKSISGHPQLRMLRKYQNYKEEKIDHRLRQ